MSFQMFSILPMPRVEWKKENMRYMLACLPFVGIVIAAILLVWMLVCRALHFGSVLFAAGMTILPAVISGGIHLDGFADTADALSSHAPPERKREILKDSHTGAFAVLYLIGFFLLYAAFCTELGQSVKSVLLVGITHVLARAVGAFASVSFSVSGNTGLLATFLDAAQKKSVWVLGIWMLLSVVGLAVLSPLSAGICLLISLLCLWGVYSMSKKQFGGMSGDIAGYLITLSELMMLLGIVVVERLVTLWF